MMITRISTPAQFAAALAIRTEVFVVEQGVSPDAEHDTLDDDPGTLHVVALSDDTRDPFAPSHAEVLGTGRLLAPGADGHPHIGRVAVAAYARGTGVGRALMEALEFAALERYGIDGHVTVALSAQVHAIPFYTTIGYIIVGEQYLDEGIWHRDASKHVSR